MIHSQLKALIFEPLRTKLFNLKQFINRIYLLFIYLCTRILSSAIIDNSRFSFQIKALNVVSITHILKC